MTPLALLAVVALGAAWLTVTVVCVKLYRWHKGW